MLQILGYHSTEAEAKRLDHNVTKLSTGDAVRDFRKDLGNMGLSNSMADVLGGDRQLANKVNDFNFHVPKMADDLD